MSDALGLSVVAKSAHYAARVVDVRLTSARRVTTPSRALYLGTSPDSEASFVGLDSGGGVVEICRPMWQTTINRIDSNNGEQRDFMNRVLPKTLQGQLESHLVLLILRLVEGQQETPWLPNDQEVNYLADLLAGFPTTTVIPPITEGFSIDDQLVYLKRFMHRVRTNSNKPVMGMIPYLDSWRDQERLQKFYLSEGLTSYVWDLHGHTPSALSPNLRSIVAHLGAVEREHGPQFAHAMNVRYSQERRARASLPARDALMPFEAFDSFGSSHVRPRMPREVRERLAENPMPPMIRLFDRRTYGYNTVANESAPDILRAALKSIGKGTLISRWIPQEASPDSRAMKQLANLVSASRLTTETVATHLRIRERTDQQYLRNRSAIQNELGRLDVARDAFKGRGLETTDESNDEPSLADLI